MIKLTISFSLRFGHCCLYVLFPHLYTQQYENMSNVGLLSKLEPCNIWFQGFCIDQVKETCV